MDVHHEEVAGLARDAVLAQLAGWLTGLVADHPVRVAIDGPDAAGKSTLADDLAAAIGPRALRVSADGFHRPAAQRRRRGSLSAEGYFEDAFDHPALRRELLDPLGPGGDRRYQTAVWDHLADVPRLEPPLLAPDDAIVLVDGVFLQRPELADAWDARIYLVVDPDEQLRRAIERDAGPFGHPDTVRERYAARYRPAHALYEASAHPRSGAEVVLDLTTPTHPRVLRAPTPPR